MEDIKVLNNKSRAPYFSSLLLLVLVLVWTVASYIYDNILININKWLQKEITQIESNITEVQNDKNIQIYSLLQLNKNVIEKYESMNKITDFINHLNTVKTKYNLQFNGFNLTDWKITTDVSVISDDSWIAFQKARDFINKYRQDTTALFGLWFINSFEWMDEIKFNVDLKIK